MNYLQQMLAELSHGAQLTIWVDGNRLYGCVHEQIGRARFEVIRPAPVGLHDLDKLVATLEEQAHEWLQENS